MVLHWAKISIANDEEVAYNISEQRNCSWCFPTEVVEAGNDIGWCFPTKDVEMGNDIGWCISTKGVEARNNNWEGSRNVSLILSLKEFYI